MCKLKNVRFENNICYFDIHSKHGIFTVLIDKEDYERCKNHSWSVSFPCSKNKYKRIETRFSDNKLKRLHRFILNIHDKYVKIDHINRNTLDNRKCNLRFCNDAQNARNCSYEGKNKTGYRGVYRNNINGKYRACISINNKTFHIPGNFHTPEEAAKIRDEWSLKVSKEFAVLNFKKQE